VQAFATAGWHVLAQMRRTPAKPLPTGATALQGPLQDLARWAETAGQVSAVVHAVNPVYTRWDAEAMPALEQGMAVAKRLGALFMLPGNVYNFGRTMPAWLQEHTAQRPDTAKGRLRVAMEDRMQAQASQGLRSVVIRAGDFFGAGQGSWLDQAIVKSLPQGKLVYPGPLDLPHAWAYLPDLARAFVAVANKPPAASFETFHFAGHTLTGRELLAAIEAAAGALGLRPARGFSTGTLPWGLIRAMGMFYPPWRELARMSYLWQVPHALDGSRLRRACPAAPTTPLPEALTQALVDLGMAQQPLQLAHT
jgi:nucleoside-diphosphate-sugar epimerase